MTELKPCPFCGGEAYVVGTMEDGSLVLGGCSNEDCVQWDVYPSVAERLWNTRPLEDVLQHRIEKLEAFVVHVAYRNIPESGTYVQPDPQSIEAEAQRLIVELQKEE